MCSFLTGIIIVITKIICPNCQKGINDFFPLIPYLLAAVSCSHCLILQQVASDIKGIFYHTNKLQLLHNITGSVYLKSSGENLRCVSQGYDWLCKSYSMQVKIHPDLWFLWFSCPNNHNSVGYFGLLTCIITPEAKCLYIIGQIHLIPFMFLFMQWQQHPFLLCNDQYWLMSGFQHSTQPFRIFAAIFCQIRTKLSNRMAHPVVKNRQSCKKGNCWLLWQNTALTQKSTAAQLDYVETKQNKNDLSIFTSIPS